ncbi:MAG: helix-turn-helix domain-containing protein [Dehalococcoidia bacterium]
MAISDAPAPIAVRPNEAARMAGISRSVLFDALGQGKLPSFKLGTSRLILVSDLQQWLVEAKAAGR